MINNQPDGEHICAIIVTYHPDTEFPSRLALVREQTGHVVIVDNHSTDAEVTMLRSNCIDSKVDAVLNPENFGIARALNIGIQQAMQLGYDWALLLDQDTLIDRNLVETLCTAYEAFPEKFHLAVIGANFRDIHRPTAQTQATRAWEEVDWVITSGSLLPLSTYADIGPFRDEFFIDFVDTEYCLRAKTKGYHVIRVLTPLMSHSIGKSSPHRLFGKTKWTTNHSADRRYYMARNNTALLREYGNYSFGGWIFKGFTSCLKPWKRILLYESSKGSKFTAVLQGWWHGVIGTMGRRR